MEWLEQGVAASLPIVQPHDWLANTVTAASFDDNGDSLNAAHVVTQGVSRLLESGTYGYDQNPPNVITLATNGQAKSDFAKGDEIVIGHATAADFDRELRERAVVKRYEYAESATQDLELYHELVEQFDVATVGYSAWNCVHKIAFTATDTANLLEHGRLLVKYTRSDSVVEKQSISFRVVKHPPKLHLTEAGLRRRWPEVFNALHRLTLGAGGSIFLHLKQAWDWVLRDVEHKGVKPEMVVDHSVWDEPVAQRALWYAARNNIIPADEDPAQWRKECRDDYWGARSRAIGNITWYDENQDLVPDASEENRRGFSTCHARM